MRRVGEEVLGLVGVIVKGHPVGDVDDHGVAVLEVGFAEPKAVEPVARDGLKINKVERGEVVFL